MIETITKTYDVPYIWQAALVMLNSELKRIMWNMHQEEYESPFNNTGNRFDKCEEFIVEAYSWNEGIDQPYNFKWRDIEISWYKHYKRGLESNKELTPDDASTMINECMNSLLRYEKTEIKNNRETEKQVIA